MFGTVMKVAAPPLTIMRSLKPGSAVPVNVGVGSFVEPPLAIAPVTGGTLSATFVIIGADGATVSTVRENVVAGLTLPAVSVATKENV